MYLVPYHSTGVMPDTDSAEVLLMAPSLHFALKTFLSHAYNFY